MTATRPSPPGQGAAAPGARADSGRRARRETEDFAAALPATLVAAGASPRPPAPAAAGAALRRAAAEGASPAGAQGTRVPGGSLAGAAHAGGPPPAPFAGGGRHPVAAGAETAGAETAGAEKPVAGKARAVSAGKASPGGAPHAPAQAAAPARTGSGSGPGDTSALPAAGPSGPAAPSRAGTSAPASPPRARPAGEAAPHAGEGGDQAAEAGAVPSRLLGVARFAPAGPAPFPSPSPDPAAAAGGPRPGDDPVSSLLGRWREASLRGGSPAGDRAPGRGSASAAGQEGASPGGGRPAGQPAPLPPSGTAGGPPALAATARSPWPARVAAMSRPAPDWRGLLSQVRGRVTALEATAGGRAALTLEPADLGRVELTLERAGSGWRLELRAETEGTARVFLERARDLHDQLARAGLRLEELRVAVAEAPPRGEAAEAAAHRAEGHARLPGRDRDDPHHGQDSGGEDTPSSAGEAEAGEDFASRLGAALRLGT